MPGNRLTISCWIVFCLFYLISAAILTALSYRFGYDYKVIEMPVFSMTASLVLLGLIFLTLPFLIHKSELQSPATQQKILTLIIATGLLIRLTLFLSEPALEDDYQRYLWDGAVTANGMNPYRHSPSDAIDQRNLDTKLGMLADQSGQLIERVNNSELRTIYPPVAQGVFAIAHIIKPWSLNSWRSICLISDAITLCLLLALLREMARSSLWVALYWLNPVVLKELFNSAHMEAILMPMVLGSLLLAIRKAFKPAAVTLALATATKIWPVILFPLLMRPLLEKPVNFIAPAFIFTAIVTLAAYPVIIAGFDHTSGFMAYAENWKTNSALFPLVESSVAFTLKLAHIETINHALISRALISFVLAAIIITLFLTGSDGAQNTITQCCTVVAALFLLSPAQFPWYLVWVLPFLVFRPSFGMLFITATIPLYYLAFHFLAYDTYEIFDEKIIWIIWLPVWLILFWEMSAKK